LYIANVGIALTKRLTKAALDVRQLIAERHSVARELITDAERGLREISACACVDARQLISRAGLKVS
jgi:hypothetical protein